MTMRVELSDQSIDALAEIISGGSANVTDPSIGLYRQGWKLVAWFKSLNVPFDVQYESRLPATRTAIMGALLLEDGDLMKRMIEKAADPRDFVSEPDRHKDVVDYLNNHFVYDNLRIETTIHGVRLVEISILSPVSGELSAMAVSIDFDTVSRDLDRALRAAGDDPEIAVTAACAVIESVCRSILVDLALPLPAKQDISSLYRSVREPLGLSPTKEGVSSEIVDDVKAVLSGLVTTVQNIGSLRTHVGGAHGKERGFKRIDARIAKLAINAASAVALFLIETWQLRFPDRTLPQSHITKS